MSKHDKIAAEKREFDSAIEYIDTIIQRHKPLRKKIDSQNKAQVKAFNAAKQRELRHAIKRLYNTPYQQRLLDKNNRRLSYLPGIFKNLEKERIYQQLDKKHELERLSTKNECDMIDHYFNNEEGI